MLKVRFDILVFNNSALQNKTQYFDKQVAPPLSCGEHSIVIQHSKMFLRIPLIT